MAHLFYDHLIPWDTLTQTLTSFNLPHDEHQEMLEHLEESIHTHVLIVILEHLPTKSHEIFIERFHRLPHDEGHLTFIHAHGGPGIEEKIRTASRTHIEELIVELLRPED